MKRKSSMKITKKAFFIWMAECIIFTGLLCLDAFARGESRGAAWFHYHGGRFYGPGFLWFNAAVDRAGNRMVVQTRLNGR
jgi:hypothetical protein